MPEALLLGAAAPTESRVPLVQTGVGPPGPNAGGWRQETAADAPSPVVVRAQLRRRLLQVILRNEAERQTRRQRDWLWCER